MTAVEEYVTLINADDHNAAIWRGDPDALEVAGGRAKAYADFRTMLADDGATGPVINAVMRLAPFMASDADQNGNGQHRKKRAAPARAPKEPTPVTDEGYIAETKAREERRHIAELNEVRVVLDKDRIPVHRSGLTEKERAAKLESDNDWGAIDSDLANGKRMATLFRDQILYVPLWGRWVLFNGKVWVPDQSARIGVYASKAVQSIYIEASKAKDEDTRQKLSKWAIRSEDHTTINDMIAEATRQNGISVAPSRFDADPWKLNVLNGTINLRTMKLEQHRREDYITKLAPVEYDQQAECPLFMKFLDRIFNADQDVIGYVQRYLGSALVGEVRDHVLMIAYGTGRNGKTTLFDTVAWVLGDYAGASAPDLLIQRTHQEHATELADLMGRRLMLCFEPNQGVKLNEARVAQLTGGDRIKARFMRQDFFDFEPSHTLVMIVNHKPRVQSDTTATWERVKLVPFEVTIPEAERDTELARKLHLEAPGILQWLLRGCSDWQQMGLATPDKVRGATSEYRATQDAFGQFLSAHVIESRGARLSAGELYDLYREWCEDAGEDELSQRDVGIIMGERGYASRKSHGRMTYINIRLRTATEIAEADGIDEHDSTHGSRGGRGATSRLSHEEGTEGSNADDHPHPPHLNTKWVVFIAKVNAGKVPIFRVFSGRTQQPLQAGWAGRGKRGRKLGYAPDEFESERAAEAWVQERPRFTLVHAPAGFSYERATGNWDAETIARVRSRLEGRVE